MKKIVMKFGGTSVATGENIRRAASLIAKSAKQGCAVVVVVSALDGVTDELSEAAEQAQKAKQDYIQKFKQGILERHLTTSAKDIKEKQVGKEVQQVIEKI